MKHVCTQFDVVVVGGGRRLAVSPAALTSASRASRWPCSKKVCFA